MRKRWRIAGSFVLLGLLAWRLDWAQLHEAFSGLDLRFWFLSAAVYMVAQIVSTLRWQLLSAPLGFRAPWRHYLSFYFIGMFFNLVLPTSVGGDVVRAFYLAAGQPRRTEAVLSVFADRAGGLAVLVAMACLAGLLSPIPLPGWIAAILAMLAGCFFLGVVLLPALPLLSRVPMVGPRLGRLVEAGRVYQRRPGLMVGTTLLSIVVQLSSVLMVWLISEGLDLQVSFAYLAVVVPLVGLLTLAPVSVNGMGLREVGMVVLLAPMNVSSAAAVTLSLLWFAGSAAVSLIGGVIYLVGRFPSYSPARASQDPSEPVKSVEGQSDAEPVGGNSDQGRMRQPPAAA